MARRITGRRKKKLRGRGRRKRRGLTKRIWMK